MSTEVVINFVMYVICRRCSLDKYVTWGKSSVSKCDCDDAEHEIIVMKKYNLLTIGTIPYLNVTLKCIS